MIARPINLWGASAQQSQTGHDRTRLGYPREQPPVGPPPRKKSTCSRVTQARFQNTWAQHCIANCRGLCGVDKGWGFGLENTWPYSAIPVRLSHEHCLFLSSSLQSISALSLDVLTLHKWPLFIHECSKRTSTLPSCLTTAQLLWHRQRSSFFF